MNLLNYVDRYSFFAVGTRIKHDFDIDDFWYSVLGVSFMIVYTIVSPVMGWLGDRYNRKALLAGGVFLWSLATIGTAFSGDFWHIFFWRALLGIGEASYGVIAPTLISDLFPVSQRGRAMGVYYLALPLGGALGYILGGTIGEEFGWCAAFWVVGLPGVLAAFAGLVMSDPGRGASEGTLVPDKTGRPTMIDYWKLFLIPTFVFNTAGMAAVTFATGALAVHGSNFYQEVRGMSMKQAGNSIGLLTARRTARDRARLVPRRLPAQVHPPRLPRSGVRRRRRGCTVRNVRDPGAEAQHIAGYPVRRDDSAFHGVRSMQYGHRQCGTREQAGVGIRRLHSFDPSFRRYQLAADPGPDFRLVRSRLAGVVNDWSVLRVHRSAPDRPREFDGRHAFPRASAGIGGGLLSDRFAVAAQGSGCGASSGQSRHRGHRPVSSLIELPGRRSGSMAQKRQQNLDSNQDDDGHLECLHSMAARLLGQQVVHVADCVHLAPDALLPAAKVKPPRGGLKHAGQY